MTDPFKLDRHDTTTSGQMGELIALEVAVIALLRSHPDREALATAWREAEDKGFTSTSDLDPRVGDERTKWAQEAYVSTMNRLRAAALQK